MRIIGIGVDIVEISRIGTMIERHGPLFLDRVFVEEERRYCDALKEPARGYAARFAAKEAVSKAFGTGIGAALGWQDIVVLRAEGGKPSIELRGVGAESASEMGISQVMISLSHSEHYAVAQSVACGE